MANMIFRLLNAGIDLEKQLDLVIGLCLDATGAQRAFLVLADAGGSWTFRVARNLDNQEIESPQFEVSRSLINKALASRKPMLIKDALTDKGVPQSESVSRLQLRSVLVVPLVHQDRSVGVIYLEQRDADHPFLGKDLDLIASFADRIAALLHDSQQARQDRDRLIRTEATLRRVLSELRSRYDFRQIIGQSQALAEALKAAARAAAAQVPVLILGESGTGKELLARAIHYNGPRVGRPFVAINCPAIPTTLMESQLFGHLKGAFTGAVSDFDGRLSEAHRGTVLLDEISEMPIEVQAKLLRTVQFGEIQRVGSSKIDHVDIRIVAATNRNLHTRVREGKFREDLFYRLNVIPITLPPLRERREDIPLLVDSLYKRACAELGRTPEPLPADALEALKAYSYPGNVRELENIIRRWVILAEGPITLYDLPAEVTASHAKRTDASAVPRNGAELQELKRLRIDTVSRESERQFIDYILTAAQGNISRAAQLAGVDRTWLQKLMARQGINAEPYKKGL